MFVYRANPVRWIRDMTKRQYDKACLPCNCAKCGNPAGSLVYREAHIPVEAGMFLNVNTRQSKLCGACFPTVVAELKRENARVHHSLPKPVVVYTLPVVGEQGWIKDDVGYGYV